MTSINDANFHIAISDWSNNGAVSTYGDITTWDTSEVTDMSFAFHNMGSFDEDISSWSMGNVSNTQSMFQGASEFNQPIGDWTMNRVINTQSMFQGAEKFNQHINNWNMEEVTNMSSMFQGAKKFNKDIGSWYTPQLTNTNSMFQGAERFNVSINNWYVARVNTMVSMFEDSGILSDFELNLWIVRSVTNTSFMFKSTFYNGDLSSWELLSLTNAEGMFENVAYENDLSNWGDLNLRGVNTTNFNTVDPGDQFSKFNPFDPFFFSFVSGDAIWASSINDNINNINNINIYETIRESIAAVSEGVPFMSGPRYGYISIDDHQTNSKSEFQVVYNDSVRHDNIIARINLAPRSVHTLSLRDSGMTSLLNRTRTYQGPVDIQKLTIKLYDEYGRIIDLNNTDWSFTLEFEKEVNRLVENDKS
tara:strand:- start:59 stop:1315 length:1257 start_codon:yes stop_codon:yes gene_type:complete